MKGAAVDTCVHAVPTPKPMALQYPQHKLVVAQIGADEGIRGLGYSLVFGGGGAEAVKEIFASPSGTSTGFGILGFFFLLVAVLSFTRGVQRLIEQTWELEPLSVRNTLNGLRWIGGLVLYLAVSGALHGVLGRSRLELSAALRWEKSRLSHHLTRMERRGLVAREECETDARGAHIALTPAGRTAIVAAAPAHVAEIRRLFVDSLPPRQLDELARISEAVLAGLADGEPDGPDRNS